MHTVHGYLYSKNNSAVNRFVCLIGKFLHRKVESGASGPIYGPDILLRACGALLQTDSGGSSMSTDETRNDQQPEEELRAVREEEADEPEAGITAEDGENSSADSAGGSEVEALKAQVEEQKEAVLRAKAEMQNVRRRAEIDVEKAHKFALEKFVKELLPVVDSLEKAIESTEGHGVASEDVVGRIREGVDMTLSMFLSGLEKFNVRQINPVGEPFDPQMHEAMSMVPSAEAEPNSVIAVMQKGYTLNDRLVRPAMVMVAKAEKPEGGNVDEKA